MGFDEIISRIRALAQQIRGRAEEIEQARQLPRDPVEGLRTCRVFRATMPAEWGSPVLTSLQQVMPIEELSSMDAAVGWCVMIGTGSGVYLRADVARQVFPRLDMVTAGWVSPLGRAEEVRGGYRADGHWRFSSGCAHADVMVPEHLHPALAAWNAADVGAAFVSDRSEGGELGWSVLRLSLGFVTASLAQLDSDLAKRAGTDLGLNPLDGDSGREDHSC
ncbi:MAG: acyl-CoA dehydrogenase family protein [Frankia sp.]